MFLFFKKKYPIHKVYTHFYSQLLQRLTEVESFSLIICQSYHRKLIALIVFGSDFTQHSSFRVLTSKQMFFFTKL